MSDCDTTTSGGSFAGGRLSAAVSWLRLLLPQGQLLPERTWQNRHRAIVALLWLHALGLAAFGVLQGYGALHSALEAALLALAALLATPRRFGRRFRAAVASLGLITASALLVHFSGGVIEMHFHFFVMVAVLMLYQDWVPFLLALGYVVLHHGVAGVVDPASVYNHPDAIAHPWRWAVIHGLFVVAASAATIVSWRVNEQLLREPLTGLAGRAVFLRRLGQALARAERSGGGVAVLFLDLDRFKAVNDGLGHDLADRLLVAVAQRLSGRLRGKDFAARLGGDEFAILCEDTPGPQAAGEVAERLRVALAEPFSIGGRELLTSASIGIALSGHPPKDPGHLLRDADVAMHTVKDAGGDGTAVFDEAIYAHVLERLEVEQELRHALERDELCLHYQPIVALADGAVLGAEALVRWQHRTRGSISPADFIPVAEDSGLILPLGDWALREACLAVQRWHDTNPNHPTPYVTVNFSARQLSQPDAVERVAKAIADTGVAPTDLYLEITESVLIKDIDAALDTLHELKRLGIGLALDDFGTGYSSLSYLRRLPCDVLKIDRSFAQALGTDIEDEAVVASILSIGATFGMSVITEGIETTQQAECLRALGGALAQGYHFAPPVPANQLESLLRRSRTARPTSP